MIREDVTPRPNWREDCEEIGFSYHSIDGVYWDESHCYRFNAAQVDELEAVTEALHQMCLKAAERIAGDDGLLERLAIPERFRERVKASWIRRETSLFGRFDLIYDGKNPPKLLEYNADTPTAILEASVAQWRWLQAVKPEADQFNSLHEKLIARWQVLRGDWPVDTPAYFTCLKDNEEDFGNIEYLRDTAMQAGIDGRFVFVEDIGWADDAHLFVDMNNERIPSLCKLYPWEWMLADEFGVRVFETGLRVVEPVWKMMLSNKGLLAVLWEMFPNHPNLLPAFFERYKISGDYVQKPLLSREGGNVAIYRGGEVIREEGTYGAEGYVYQAYTGVPKFGDSYTTIGSWIVGDQAAGIGIREDATPITCNTSRFVPHYFV
jgi:glutathionylspermidine synthase